MEEKIVIPINTMVAVRGMKDDMRTCFGVGEPGDPQFTISAAHCHAICFQQNQRDEVRNMGEQTGSIMSMSGMHNQNFLCIGIAPYNGSITGDISATITAEACSSAGHSGPSVLIRRDGKCE